MLGLRLQIDSIDFHGLKLKTAAGWQRQTTTVVLSGLGCKGYGEDVTYSSEEQEAFRDAGPPQGLGGSYSLASFSAALDDLAPEQWFTTAPAQEAAWHFRRWAFESAALDLALRQAKLRFADWMGFAASPVHFAHSVGLGEPPSIDILKLRMNSRRSTWSTSKVITAAVFPAPLPMPKPMRWWLKPYPTPSWKIQPGPMHVLQP